MFHLNQRLKHIKIKLKEWNKKEFGKIFKAKGEVEKNYRKLIKFSSQKASQRKEKCKWTHFNENGTTYVRRRKSSRDKNPECNGLRTGREIPGSFTSQPWNIGHIIRSQNL